MMCDLPYTEFKKKNKNGKPKPAKKDIERVIELNKKLLQRMRAKAGIIEEEQNNG